MKILHVNAGNEFGGGLFHIQSLFRGMDTIDMELLVFEEGPVADMARKSGITVYILSQQSRYDIRVLKKLRQLIQRNGYTVVHTHGPRANLFVSLIHRLIAAKWIMTVHSDPTLDFEHRGIKGKLFEQINLRTLKKPDHLIAVSKEIKSILMQNNVSASQVSVVHNGRAFSEDWKPAAKDTSIFRMLTVGRLEKVKGHRYLIEALRQLDFSDWMLTICGSGEEEVELKALVNRSGLTEKVLFLGWIDSEEVSRQFSKADVMILPSLSESFPLVALEAGEKRLPVIASEVGDVKDMIPSEQYGWLVPKGNSTALKKAIEQAHHEWKTGRLEAVGKSFYAWSRQFTIEKQGNETVEVYRKVSE